MHSTTSLRVGSLGERLAQQLRVAIVRGEFADGERIVEEALAERFDVSRGPVRDALRTLTEEQLVVPERRGYRVRAVSAEDVDELYDVRGALERLAVCTIAAKPEAIDWSPAEHQLALMAGAADSGDWYSYAAHDLEFHSVLYRLALNRRLSSMWDCIEPTFAVILQQTNKQDVDLHPSHADHARLLESIRAGRSEDALRYLEEHLDGSRRRMKLSLSQPRR